MYKIILTPLIAAMAAQLCKFFIKSNRLKFNWRSLMSYAGMPSSHAAMTVSLCAIVGLAEDWSSPLFAISLVFTILVIRDAMGLRRYIGQHGEMINDLVKDLRRDNIELAQKYPRLIEKIGHTPAQIIAGGAIGLAISLISYYFI